MNISRSVAKFSRDVKDNRHLAMLWTIGASSAVSELVDSSVLIDANQSNQGERHDCTPMPP